MTINLLVMLIVERVNELSKLRVQLGQEKQVQQQQQQTTVANSNEKHATSLLYVILEICKRDLIKYLPNLLQSTSADNGTQKHAQATSTGGQAAAKSSFLFLHVSTCKMLTAKDVELLRHVINVLVQLPFHNDLTLAKRISLISINYHILFNLLESTERLLAQQAVPVRSQLEKALHELTFEAFKSMCSTSSANSAWHQTFMAGAGEEAESNKEQLASLISIQQSALMSTLGLKSTLNYIQFTHLPSLRRQISHYLVLFLQM